MFFLAFFLVILFFLLCLYLCELLGFISPLVSPVESPIYACESVLSVDVTFYLKGNELGMAPNNLFVQINKCALFWTVSTCG